MVLPAHAGMIPQFESFKFIEAGAPRTCGDDPLEPALTALLAMVLPAHAGMILVEGA